MPSEIDLEMPPCGYVITSGRGGETALVQYMEFTSTEDGQHFIQRLEGRPNDILRRLPTPPGPSQIDSMLAIVRRDGKATVFVNELPQIIRVQASRPIEKGATITKNEVVDLDHLELGVKIPADAGILFLFSVGWRKGLFYDFGPVGRQHPGPRTYDLGAMLGQCYRHVLFQERFSISDIEWAALLEAKWFPFAGLRNETIDRLISWVRSGRDPDDILEQIVSETKNRVPEMLDAWRGHPSFTPHLAILDPALEHFRKDDFVSCTAMMFPRIEGLLRTYQVSRRSPGNPSPDNLTRNAVASKHHDPKSLLLPQRFAVYLRDVFFANFNPQALSIDVSRHSVAHGVADATKFDQKSAVIGILVVHQLFYFLERHQGDQMAR